MRISQRLPALGVLVFALGALAFLTASIGSLTPAIAQQQSTNATSPEAAPEGEAAMTEEHTHESSSNETATETFTVRDSVFALLADQTIPSNSFIHLYDTTPYSIRNGHVAAKIPCDDESAPLLNIVVGVAPDLAPAPLELVPPLSTPGELCLYHADLPGPAQANATTTANATAANATMITDIAIQNPSDEDVTLPSTSTVVIGVNEIEQGAHSHEEEG
jgi:hypothetical protein